MQDSESGIYTTTIPGTGGTGPKVGQRVRVTEVREGVVSDSSGDGTIWLVKQSRPVHLGIDRADYSASVEVLPDPEPAWWPPKPGDVVRYEDSTYLYDDNSEVWRNTGGIIMDGPRMKELHRPHRPLTLLVRDGRAVSAD